MTFYIFFTVCPFFFGLLFSFGVCLALFRCYRNSFRFIVMISYHKNEEQTRSINKYQPKKKRPTNNHFVWIDNTNEWVDIPKVMKFYPIECRSTHFGYDWQIFHLTFADYDWKTHYTNFVFVVSLSFADEFSIASLLGITSNLPNCLLAVCECVCVCVFGRSNQVRSFSFSGKFSLRSNANRIYASYPQQSCLLFCRCVCER